MSHNLPRTHNVYHVEQIDGRISGSIEIVTIDSRRFFPSLCIVELKSSNALSSVPKISVGTEGGNREDLIPATVLEGLLNANTYMKYHFSGIKRSLTSGATIKLYVLEPATGGNGLEYQFDVILSGIHL